MIVCEFQQTDRRELEISKVLPADPQCECIAVPCFYVRMMLFAGVNRCLYICITNIDSFVLLHEVYKN